jgi:predicted GNAT family acetyltransferase
MAPDILRDNAARKRFEIAIEGHTVFADYDRQPGQLIINWVEAPRPLRGTGAAGRLMALVAEQARSERVKIVPVCGYAAGWLRASKAYRDLVA